MASPSDYCSTKLWDFELLRHPSRPDFTDCFHSTVLALTPCLFLWIFFPFYFKLFKIHLKASRRSIKPTLTSSWIYLIKIMILAAMMTSIIVGLIFPGNLGNIGIRNLKARCDCLLVVADSIQVSRSLYVTPAAVLITLFYDLIGVTLHRLAHHCSSKIQFYFWIISATLHVPTFASSVR